MPRSESMKEAQKRYMIRVQGTEVGERIRRAQAEASKRAFNKRYANNILFRESKNAYELQKYYYRSAENDGVLRNLRSLYGGYLNYGR